MSRRHDPRQMLLFSLPPEPSPRARALARPHSYFFALRPPLAVGDGMVCVARELALNHDGKMPMSPDRLHLSLCGLGSYTDPAAALIESAMIAAAAVRIPPFDVAFDRVQTFRNRLPWPIVLRCSTGETEIAALHRAIAAALTRAGLDTRLTPGTPHLTLWRTTQFLPEHMVVQPFCWRVTKFWLIHSIQGTGTHRWPGQWPLIGAPSESLCEEEPLLL